MNRERTNKYYANDQVLLEDIVATVRSKSRYMLQAVKSSKPQ